MSQVIEERMDLERPCGSKKLAKKSQNDPTLAKPTAQIKAPKEHKTQCWRSKWTGRDRAHPGPCSEVHGRSPTTHNRACPVPFGVFPFFVLLRFPARFYGFCLYNRMYLDTLSIPNTTPIPYHSPISIRVRLVLERKKERRRLQGIHAWFRIERFKYDVWLSFLFLLLCFLILILCCVIFDLDIVVWSWIYANCSLISDLLLISSFLSLLVDFINF